MLTNLKPNTVYDVRITGRNDLGEGEKSIPLFVTTDESSKFPYPYIRYSITIISLYRIHVSTLSVVSGLGAKKIIIKMKKQWPVSE